MSIPAGLVPELCVWVAGDPAPQGSKRHVGRGVLIESSKRVKPWRQDVREACLAAIAERGGTGAVLIPGPCKVHVEFVLRRPASAPKRSTPPAAKRPDVDKLARAVLDALSSAGVYADDARVIDLHVTKRIAEIGEQTGCLISVTAVP